MKLSARPIVFFFCFSLIILLMVYCGDGSDKKETVENKLPSTTYLNHSDTAKYIGMDQCRLCHQDIYNSFIETGMGKSFDIASKLKSSARFNNHSIIYDKEQDFYYKPYWDKDTFKIMEFRLKGFDTIHKRIEKVDYIIGSGQHTNSHIYNTSGYLHQMPMTFYTQKGEWHLPPGFENGFNTRFSRKIGLECMSCHNSYPDFVLGSENKYKSVPNGINCERCHGPGSIHVQQRMSGEKIDTSKFIDYSIVNPGKLPIDLQFDVCQRCHLQGNTVLKDGKSFYDFRPGMKLSDYMTTFLPRYEGGDDEFIMASHADRLKQSQCFIKSFKPEDDAKSLRPYKQSLTCVTCHNPHKSVKVTDNNVFNNACKNCHGGQKQTNCTEKIAVRNLKQDNCVSCHMPKSGSSDIPHVTVHDHYIRRPIKKEQVEKVKKFIGLYAVNEKNPSNKTKAKAYILQYEKFEFKTYYLDSAQLLLPDKAIDDVKSNFELLVQLYFNKQDYKKINEYVTKIGKYNALAMLATKTYENQNAWTAYRIGEAMHGLGNVNDAYLFYKRADELAPYSPDFKNKLGVSLMALNKTQEGINTFETVVDEHPKYVQAMNNLAYAYLTTGRVEQAEFLYKKALALDPDYEPLLMNVAGFYVFKKDYKKAKEYLNLILKKNPKNEQAKMLLKQINSLG